MSCVCAGTGWEPLATTSPSWVRCRVCHGSRLRRWWHRTRWWTR